jgi:Flp pilus assembly protein TadB
MRTGQHCERPTVLAHTNRQRHSGKNSLFAARTSLEKGGLHDRDRARWEGDRHEGWRAWVIGAFAVGVTAIVLGAVTLVLGIAASVAALVMILIAVIAVVALLVRFCDRREGDPAGRSNAAASFAIDHLGDMKPF